MKNSKTNMKWDSSELSFLKKHPHMSAARVAKKLKRTVKAVEMNPLKPLQLGSDALGIRADYGRPHTSVR